MSIVDPHSPRGLLAQIQMDVSEEIRRALEDGDSRLVEVLCAVRVKTDQVVLQLTDPAANSKHHVGSWALSDGCCMCECRLCWREYDDGCICPDCTEEEGHNHA